MADRRDHPRLETLFAVTLESSEHGVFRCIARNISKGGIFLETPDPLPLGSEIRIHFDSPQLGTKLVAVGTVRNHYFFHYGPDTAPKHIIGMGVRFSDIEKETCDCDQILQLDSIN
ncbi:MAG: PilZ domain-containing protein [Pseudomonadota bacterium]